MADRGHKSGPLKQANKTHKTLHRSKGALKKEFGGKVDQNLLRPSIKKKLELSREARRQQSKASRKIERQQNKQKSQLRPPLLVYKLSFTSTQCLYDHGLLVSLTLCAQYAVTINFHLSLTHPVSSNSNPF